MSHLPIVRPSIQFVKLAKNKVASPFEFGGLPQLPDSISWPRAISYSGHDKGSLHFFAQINLPSLSRSMEQAGQRFEMPNFPCTGTLFIFLPLDGDSMYNEVNCAVRYYPGSVAHFPERMPPSDTRMIIDRRVPGDTDTFFYEDSYVVRNNPEAVSDCGRYLQRVYAEPETALTFMQSNPVFESKDRHEFSEEELFELDSAHALKLKEYDITAKINYSRSDDEWQRRRRNLARKLGTPTNPFHSGSAQMFGVPNQWTEPYPKNKILLFELGSFAGVNFGSIDGDYWIWIDEDDLSKGKFDDAYGLMYSS